MSPVEAFGVDGTGRSSITETPAREPIGRGVLGRPLEPVIGRRFAPTRWRAMTDELAAFTRFSRFNFQTAPWVCVRILATAFARALHQLSPSRIPRAQGRPGDRMHPGPRAKNCAKSALTTGTGGISPVFPARRFTAYSALPGEPACLPPSPARDFRLAQTWRLHGRARTTRLRRPR